MNKSKQSFYTLSVRLSEKEYQQFLIDCEGVSKSAYLRRLIGKNIGKSTTMDKSIPAKILALLGKSRLFTNINQIAHAMNSGTFKLTPEIEASIRELKEDIRFIRASLMKLLGMKV